MTDREKFEAWATAEQLHLAMEEGEYMSGVTRLAHRTWVASRHQMAEEAAALADRQKEIGDRNEDHSWEICAAQLAFAIRSLATPTEGKT